MCAKASLLHRYGRDFHGKSSWVITSNFYLGNREEQPLDESCRSPVLKEDGEVFGLFLFMTNNGKAYCVPVRVLMETGLKLSSIGEE